VKTSKPVLIVLFSLCLFVFCFLIAILFEPNTFHKFFSAISLEAIENSKEIKDKAGYYYDVTAYAVMVIKNKCLAFYPMVPWITRYLFNPQGFEQAVIGLKVISSICFVIGIPLFYYLCEKISKNQNISLLVTLLFTISPMAIFRVIGYTEGVFSLFCMMLIWLINNLNTSKRFIYLFTFILVFVMSLCRPVTLQLAFSSLTSLAIIVLIEKLRSSSEQQNFISGDKDKHRHLMYLSLVIIFAALLGYCVYGSICLELRGDFLAPFNDQKLWGKSLGFYPQIFWSLEYPLFEQMSLYFPIFLLIGVCICLYTFVNQISIDVFIPSSSIGWCLLSLYPSIFLVVYILKFFVVKSKRNKLISVNLYKSLQAKELFDSYTFWFCLSFVMSHIIVNLLTSDKIYSLARFTFSLPFFFVVLIYILRNLRYKGIDNFLKWFVFVEAIALVEQWIRYGKNQWLG
jgi:hypothetical protein